MGWVESISSLKENDAATELVARDPQFLSNIDFNGKDQGREHSMTPEERFEAETSHLVFSLALQVEQHGEAVLEVGGTESGMGPVCHTEEELETVLEALERLAQDKGFSKNVVRRRVLSDPNDPSQQLHMGDVCLRRCPGVSPPFEIRVAIVGNVDSGKSTMVGVLTRGILDDGRGLARSKVFKHGHEESTGRTSSIGQHVLCLDAEGRILNDSSMKNANMGDYVQQAAKVLTLVDLAGHEKYFKTTAYGLTGHMPDYACLIVGGNAGIVGMCKEHLGIALALRVPVFFVVTKIDLAPEHVLQHTITTLQAILKKPGVRKKPFLIRTRDDVITCARHIHSDSLAPIFLTSSVTGEGLDFVRLFYNLLPQRVNWSERMANHAEFVIDETFSVPGVGTVVAGTVKEGVITAATSLMLGPDIRDGSFKSCTIKSIHYKRVPVTRVVAGQTAALALKKVKKHQVRKGMVLAAEALKPAASWEFDADIAILTHATTIQPKYQAVIHCEIVRQTARVIAMDMDILRSGDRACVRFRFIQHPEYLRVGSRFVFREGRTKGIGVIVGTEASPLIPPAE